MFWRISEDPCRPRIPGLNHPRFNIGVNARPTQVREGQTSRGRPQARPCPTISGMLMPRAYIEMIFSSKPGNRRWYLAIKCGSKLGIDRLDAATNQNCATRSPQPPRCRRQQRAISAPLSHARISAPSSTESCDIYLYYLLRRNSSTPQPRQPIIVRSKRKLSFAFRA